MIYVSIPVHEAIEVIMDQVTNFIKFLPDCHIILHISKQASFTKNQLTDFFNKKNIKNVLINPLSIDTSWGNIIRAHICNINYINKLSTNLEDKVIFHASNDMIIKEGLDVFTYNNNNLFHTRYCDRLGDWWPANVSLTQDQKFLKALREIGAGRVVASQIEGSMYQLGLLNEIINLIEKYNITENNTAFYPYEEFYFSSFAHALGVIPDNTPYVYSEVHYFDMTLWNMFHKIDKSFLPQKNFIKKHVNKILFKSKFYKINKQVIDDLIFSKHKKIEFLDGANYWNPYPDTCQLYGVKRISRNINDKTRRHIKSVTQH